ncbi:response regulator transcription factor [Sedimenticola sp.]|uniref:response regulator transcription factor n=1 Tax=Sedimenticola sp. TaxID=1940285 RepID=UPI003D14A80B
MRIAVLEDNEDQIKMLQLWLQEAGHHCHPYIDAAGFQRSLQRSSFDLLLIDWELPVSSGIEVLQWVRQYIDWPIPVLFMTARDAESDIVYALEQGADDYIVKPASRAVTVARINALGRRLGTHRQEKTVLEFGDISIDVGRSEIRVRGDNPELTEREFQLAVMLFNNIGRLISRDHLLEHIWGISANIATRTVDTHVSRLRQKLQLIPEYGWQLKAVYQHGYRLEQLDA